MSEEPLIRPEEFSYHLKNQTLHEESQKAKEQLALDRNELAKLMNRNDGTDEELERKIQVLKTRIVKRHDELMEILKNEVRISQENNKNHS